jgi:hypothetical protein
MVQFKMKYFVYVRNSHGLPEPQIWHSMITDGNGKAKQTLMLHEIKPEDDMLSLGSLAAKYPYEAKE